MVNKERTGHIPRELVRGKQISAELKGIIASATEYKEFYLCFGLLLSQYERLPNCPAPGPGLSAVLKDTCP
jgi:hypothetical protein